MNLRLLAIALGALMLASAANAATYVRVEKDGTKTYSDRPIPGGQPVELEPAQTYSAPPGSGSATSSVSRETQLVREMDNFRYEACDITPRNDEQISNPRSVNIVVSLKPLLRVGDVVNLSLDGAVVSSSGALTYTMNPAIRGTHTVAVEVKDRYGRAVCKASSQFHVFQPGLNSPSRRTPPAPPRR